MTIITGLVGSRTGEKPVIFDDGDYVTYMDLDEPRRFQLWVGQAWGDEEDSESIKAARDSITRRSFNIKTYTPDDDVHVESSGKKPHVISVLYVNVITFLAQRLGYSVVPNESGGQTSRSHITKQPLQQPPSSPHKRPPYKQPPSSPRAGRRTPLSC
jgi:hypothetical protein